MHLLHDVAGEEHDAVLEPVDLYEYLYYVNAGSFMSDIMHAMTATEGKQSKLRITDAEYS